MQLELRQFEPRFAPVITSWIRTELDLLWLAPKNAPPLTDDDVIAWTRSARTAKLLFVSGEADPCGYGEITPAKTNPGHLWIGHIVVDVERRGQGLGSRFVALLLREAFEAFVAEKVLLVVFPDNEAAIRCYERSGLVHRGEEWYRFRPRGPRHRMLRMEIVRRSWLNREARQGSN